MSAPTLTAIEIAPGVYEANEHRRLFTSGAIVRAAQRRLASFRAAGLPVPPLSEEMIAQVIGEAIGAAMCGRVTTPAPQKCRRCDDAAVANRPLCAKCENDRGGQDCPFCGNDSLMFQMVRDTDEATLEGCDECDEASNLPAEHVAEIIARYWDCYDGAPAE